MTEPFTPNWTTTPGEHILDAIEERGWTPAELARRLGYSLEYTGKLTRGNIALTHASAQRLAEVLGSTPDFWLRLQANCRKHQARLTQQAEEHTALTLP